MKITLNLTEEEADKLVDILESYEDCGPLSEGWQSPEVEALSMKVSEAIRENQ